MSLEQLKQEGWKVIDRFAFDLLIVEKDEQHMLVEEKTGKKVISY